MRGDNTRLRIENEMFGRMEKKYSEEERANCLMGLLLDNDPLLEAMVRESLRKGGNAATFCRD